MAKKKSSQRMTRTSKKKRASKAVSRSRASRRSSGTAASTTSRKKRVAGSTSSSSSTRTSARSDYGANADDYFSSIESARVKAIANWARKIVRRSLPGARECIKWGIPCYTESNLICAVVAQKSYAAVQFYDTGTSISDPKRLLEGTGKRCRHIKLHEQRADLAVELARMVQEASRLSKL